MLSKPLPPEDLEQVLTLASESFMALRGARIFLTGGTGFFGHWLLESLVHANRAKSIDLQVTVLTRNAARFRTASPWIAEAPAVTLLEGDVRNFDLPATSHSHILHAATDSVGQQDEHSLADEIIEGTRHVLHFAKQTEARRLLYVSSGAIYGRGITDVTQIAETYPGSPSPTSSAYDTAKKAAEDICLQSGIDSVLARCFAFVGPRLPLDAHFALGNFIGDAMAGRRIHIKGDGTPMRSYLYMSDLAAWLWTLLAQGQPSRAYNVGSDAAISIAALAKLTAETLRPGLKIQIDGIAPSDTGSTTYVPSIERARSELGLHVGVELREAIIKTAAWYRG
jgi:nucleoside-diphosphate-sugar epimerase